MRKFIRSDSPDFLKTNWQKWGKKYENSRKINTGFTFQWPIYKGEKINILLEPTLSHQTDFHCSYCDNFPVKSKEDSIDHFKPKSNELYYELVCKWENLYYCCQNCQQYKREQYNDNLLRPDDVDFSFESYFIYSFNSHKIEPNPASPENNKLKAITTINVFGLNDAGQIAARRISLERYESKKKLNENIEINDFPYRFTIFE